MVYEWPGAAFGTEIRLRRVDGAGIDSGSIDIDTQAVNAETLIKVVSDEAGGVVVLYEHGGSLYVQRIDSSNSRLWGANGRPVGNPLPVDAPDRVDMVYVAASDDVIVAAQIGNNIWAVFFIVINGQY